MSETPETDAQLTTFTSLSKLGKRFTNRTGQVSAEFARKLERERNSWRSAANQAVADRDALKQMHDAAQKLVTSLAFQKDSWRECADTLADLLESVRGQPFFKHPASAIVKAHNKYQELKKG
jgi:hypothetical protein